MVLVTKLMKAPATITLTFALLTGVAFVGCGEADTGAASESATGTAEEKVDDVAESDATGGGSDKKDNGSNRKEE